MAGRKNFYATAPPPQTKGRNRLTFPYNVWNSIDILNHTSNDSNVICDSEQKLGSALFWDDMRRRRHVIIITRRRVW
jgi:hypothetical protein